ncbi:hypothetical protein [Clavibacter sp. VKM Ac-2872]|uniref:hypothetical protein n=1 Tax=Clavibacter sp. VKM Ac-2872 TaxID=2783812 RepID=UPI00188A2283|nr:hypothetical protein [Clavibacter sp. VKM Ac-2872]MBF4625814.1 hypothetical protein [Clavibacter sp. VKM Ac-2872]
MPNRSVPSRRATQLQRFTRLPYSTALRLLQADRRALEPTPEQERLEGLVFDGFRSISYGPTPGTVTQSIACVEPARRSLTIHPGPGFELGDLVGGVTPLIEDGMFVSGVAGARLAWHPRGAVIHRPGIDAAVIFAGVPLLSWLKAARTDDPALRFATMDAIGRHERERWDGEGRWSSRYSSVVLRRLGMLDALDATSVHMYGWHRGRMVEVIQPRAEPEMREQMIADLERSGLHLSRSRDLGGHSALLDFATPDERDGVLRFRFIHSSLSDEAL